MKLFYMPGVCSLIPYIVLEWISKPFELGRVEHGNTREIDACFQLLDPSFHAATVREPL